MTIVETLTVTVMFLFKWRPVSRSAQAAVLLT